VNELLTAKPRILVVDHEPMSRTLLDAVLRTDNRYDVLTACDGRQGLESARSARPDLVMVSAHLPPVEAGQDGIGGKDGFAVCRHLKEEARTRRIPIILVMAQTTTSERVQGFEAGADDFVCKPFNRIELLARVRSLLRIKALNDQLDEVEDVMQMAYLKAYQGLASFRGDAGYPPAKARHLRRPGIEADAAAHDHG